MVLAIVAWTMAYPQSTVVYEDFEDGTADLPWVGINGSYDGAVANPDMSGANTSAFVGSYTTNEGSDFNFAIADLPMPADMDEFGVVTVKIWSPVAPSQCLLKFEGSGAPVEMFQDITVANEWVEYSFDLSSGAANMDGLTKCLISFHSFLPGIAETFYWDDIIGHPTKECYETFEDGLGLPWNGIDGEFTGPVANPGPNRVNDSDSCGRYVKSDATAYSLLLADNGDDAFDLSARNQFSVQVYATAATQILMKLEGDGGAIEQTKNIALTGVWQEYTFDFSDAADNDGLTKAILFFDPGVEMSRDTYYFDNLCALPPGVCGGVDSDPMIMDDFECQRNATYSGGWDSLTVVDNPAPSAVNESSKVGRYGDPVAEPWGALVADYHNPLDLSEYNQFSAKIWSPKEVQILFKLEGGASPPKEVWMDVPAANQWVEYSIDFSSEALNSHRKVVLFMNAGVEPDTGDVYFIDDLRWSKASSVVIEDFEEGAFLPWEPLDQQTVLHGNFAVIANPDASGINESSMVGEYAKGTASFSTLAAVAPGAIDISTLPQYNLDVWAPDGAMQVTMQLESVAQGNKEVTRDIPATQEWTTVGFNFEEFQNIDDWVSLRLIFDPGVAAEGSIFYFDNLTQSASTVDACEGVIPIDNIVDDFECQRNRDLGVGSEFLSVVNNPLTSVINGSTLSGLYVDQPNEPWSALCYEVPDGIDLDVFNQLSMSVYAEQGAPILMKLEGGSSPPAEIWTEYTTPGEWERLTVDFSGQAGMDHKRICFFLNGGVDHPEGTEDYYIDDIALEHAPYTDCLLNFDDEAYTATEWLYFPHDDAGAFAVVDNPDPSGINTSAKVGECVERANGEQPWQGMYTDLPSYIVFDENKLVKMKVWSPKVTSITMKLENPQNPDAPGSSGDNTVQNTVANEWEELTFDFSASPNPIPDDGRYQRITLIFDIENVPGEDVVYYIDDVQLDGAGCMTTSIFRPIEVEELRIAPNPVSDMLTVYNVQGVNHVVIMDYLGQVVARVSTTGADNAYLDVSNLPSGMYVLGGYDRDGHVIANARFVKQ